MIRRARSVFHARPCSKAGPPKRRARKTNAGQVAVVALAVIVAASAAIEAIVEETAVDAVVIVMATVTVAEDAKAK